MDYYSKKIKLFFDIETIPAEEKLRDLAVGLSLEKEFRKNGKVNKSKKYKEFLYRQSAISGDFGRVFCIGYAIDDGKTQIISGNEHNILEKWWEISSKIDLFIGHNIMDFDLRFLFKRSVINKIKPNSKHLNLSFARYRNFPIYDTMREWEKWNTTSFIKLDTLAKILSLPSSKDGGIDGSQVYDFYKAGKHEEIYEYCKRDVELTRKVYKVMNFED